MLGLTIEEDQAVFSNERAAKLLMKQEKASFCCCEKYHITTESKA